MKEEAQGFPTAWGSMGFLLHPKALGVSENEFVFGKSKLTMGALDSGHNFFHPHQSRGRSAAAPQGRTWQRKACHWGNFFFAEGIFLRFLF